MPPNPPDKAHGFAMRSMSLRDMQISKSEKKILGPPLPNPGDAPGYMRLTLDNSSCFLLQRFKNKHFVPQAGESLLIWGRIKKACIIPNNYDWSTYLSLSNTAVALQL